MLVRLESVLHGLCASVVRLCCDLLRVMKRPSGAVLRRPAGAGASSSGGLKRPASVAGLVLPPPPSTCVSPADKFRQHVLTYWIDHERFLLNLRIEWWPRQVPSAKGVRNYTISGSCGSAFTLRLTPGGITFVRRCIGNLQDVGQRSFSFSKCIGGDVNLFLYDKVKLLCPCPPTVWNPLYCDSAILST